MTFWRPFDVLKMAQTAGFPGQAAKEATALAFVATDGADHFRWTHPSTPGVDFRGLYGLDVRRVSIDDASELDDPNTSSEWAYALWKHYGQGWHWHPAYTANDGASLRAMLMALDSDKGWMNRPGVFYERTRLISRPDGLGNLHRPRPQTAGEQSPAEQEALWQITTP